MSARCCCCCCCCRRFTMPSLFQTPSPKYKMSIVAILNIQQLPRRNWDSKMLVAHQKCINRIFHPAVDTPYHRSRYVTNLYPFTYELLVKFERLKVRIQNRINFVLSTTSRRRRIRFSNRLCPYRKIWIASGIYLLPIYTAGGIQHQQ